MEEENSVCVTKHAEKRIRQRLGINKKAMERNAEKAIQYGVSHSPGTLASDNQYAERIS